MPKVDVEAARAAAELLTELKVADRVAALEVNRQAEQVVRERQALAGFREPPDLGTLADQLARPREAQAFTVDGLHPTGGNSTLAAQYKTGKTTIALNLATALADGEPFLGSLPTKLPDGGNIAFWNLELTESAFLDWCERLSIRNPQRIMPLHLRGRSVPLNTDAGRAWAARWLRDRDVAFWICDPWARVLGMCGGGENDNDAALVVTEALDAVKTEAGVADLLVPTHTGRAQFEEGAERARGATRLDDWVDARWVLTRGKNGPDRYLYANGRDVDFPESRLAFDQTSHRLTVVGGGRAQQRDEVLEFAIAGYLRTHPDASVREVRQAVRAAGHKGRNEVIDTARVRVAETAQRRADAHERESRLL